MTQMAENIPVLSGRLVQYDVCFVVAGRLSWTTWIRVSPTTTPCVSPSPARSWRPAALSATSRYHYNYDVTIYSFICSSVVTAE